jgi:hypothetical protein
VPKGPSRIRLKETWTAAPTPRLAQKTLAIAARAMQDQHDRSRGRGEGGRAGDEEQGQAEAKGMSDHDSRIVT